MTTVTKQNAERWLAKYGTIEAAAKVMKVGKAKIEAALGQKGEEFEKAEAKVAAASGGFSLQGMQLIAKRPTDVWGPRFNALKLDTGYLAEVLAKQWGCSLNSVRDHAREKNAIRWTEHEGQYVEVIVNPKTRGGK